MIGEEVVDSVYTTCELCGSSLVQLVVLRWEGIQFDYSVYVQKQEVNLWGWEFPMLPLDRLLQIGGTGLNKACGPAVSMQIEPLKTRVYRISWVYVQYMYYVNWVMRACYYAPYRSQKTKVLKLHRITSQRA